MFFSISQASIANAEVKKARPITNIQVRVNSQQKGAANEAGKWDHFEPGPGHQNQNPNDFVMQFEVTTEVTFNALTVLHNVCGEGWSTTRNEKYLNKSLFPLVIFRNGEKLNVEYEAKLKLIPGSYIVYLQPESPIFEGGLFIVELMNGMDYLLPIGTPAKCTMMPFEEIVKEQTQQADSSGAISLTTEPAASLESEVKGNEPTKIAVELKADPKKANSKNFIVNIQYVSEDDQLK